MAIEWTAADVPYNAWDEACALMESAKAEGDDALADTCVRALCGDYWANVEVRDEALARRRYAADSAAAG